MSATMIAVLGLAIPVGLTGCTPGPASDTETPATSRPTPDGTTMPPWPAPTDVADRVAAAGLDLGPMGTAEHYHPTLQILIRGQQVTIPANIGVDPATGAMSALHTHEPNGTIHIEADTAGQVFTLGQLFTQWAVTLTATQIGGVKAAPGQTVQVRSNGTTIRGNPAKLRLRPDQRIILNVP